MSQLVVFAPLSFSQEIFLPFFALLQPSFFALPQLFFFHLPIFFSPFLVVYHLLSVFFLVLSLFLQLSSALLQPFQHSFFPFPLFGIPPFCFPLLAFSRSLVGPSVLFAPASSFAAPVLLFGNSRPLASFFPPFLMPFWLPPAFAYLPFSYFQGLQQPFSFLPASLPAPFHSSLSIPSFFSPQLLYPELHLHSSPS